MTQEYPDFVESTGYGTGEGLCGWNCRHSFFPFYPGVSRPHYTPEALAALNAKDVEYNGKKYTRYEVSQMQRALERQVRAAKRSFVAQEAAGLDTTAAAARLKAARKQLAQFCLDTGGKQAAERTLTPGFGEKQAKASNEAAKKLLTNAAGQPILEVKRVSLKAEPNSITQVTYAKGGKTRAFYGSNGSIVKEISNNDHGHVAEKGFGQHGEHAHDWLRDEDGRPIRQRARELTDAERKENEDFL